MSAHTHSPQASPISIRPRRVASRPESRASPGRIRRRGTSLLAGGKFCCRTAAPPTRHRAAARASAATQIVARPPSTSRLNVSKSVAPASARSYHHSIPPIRRIPVMNSEILFGSLFSALVRLDAADGWRRRGVICLGRATESCVPSRSQHHRMEVAPRCRAHAGSHSIPHLATFAPRDVAS